MSSVAPNEFRFPPRVCAVVAISAVALTSCNGPSARPEPVSAAAPELAEPPPSAAPSVTWSPQPAAERDALSSLCAQTDAALARVALETAAELRDGARAPDSTEIARSLRYHGSPYVWPRAWTLSGPKQPLAEIQSRLEQWLASFRHAGESRCGAATLPTASGAEIVVVVAVDALADLTPLPRSVAVSAWLEVEARLLVPSSGAKVVVLGPRGAPKPLPTSLDGSRVSARFRADAAGEWWVQVLAETRGGPRPVLDAQVFAGGAPERGAGAPAPGEDQARAGDAPAVSLGRMLDGARGEHGLPPLTRDPELDAIAQAHAEQMQAERRIAHDLGSGDPETRIEALGRAVTRTGENVARADSIVRAHRALFRSPSHRANLLDPHFDAVGIGVALDANGVVWVCQLFARFMR